MSTALIVVMAKAPVAGLAKTRLAPRWVPTARRRWRALLVHAVAQAQRRRLGPVELCATPDAGHPAIVRLGPQHGLALGCRATAISARACTVRWRARCLQHERALLIGTDVPALDAACCAAPPRHWPRTTPSSCRRSTAATRWSACAGRRRLFDDMTWSTPQVMAHTRQRAAAAGLRVAELGRCPTSTNPPTWCTCPRGGCR
jgi:uncharacterized protein